MIHKVSNILNKNFYLLGTTAFPGIHKLVILLFISFLFKTNATGNFVNDIFIIYIFGYLTVFNWANFILVEMSKLPSKFKPLFFGKILWLSISMMIPIIVIIFILFKFGIIIDLFGTSLFLFSWSFHQLWRHYYIAQKKFKDLFYSDVIIISFTIFNIYLAFIFSVNIFVAQTIPLLLIPVLYKIIGIESPAFYFEFRSFFKVDWRIYKRALNYSLINLSTGGIQLIIAPLSYQLLNAEFTAIIGITNNIATTALLIPRAISYNYIPELAKEFRLSIYKFKEVLSDFQKKINISVVGLAVVGLIFCVVASILYPNLKMRVVFLSSMVYINLLTSQLSLPWSNAIFVMRKNEFLLKINVFSFSIYIVLLLLFFQFFSNGYYIIVSATVLNILINFFRYMTLKSTQV